MLEIIDTAVKIGLGALISGISAYLITRLQQKGIVENERRNRRAKIFQDVAEQIEIINHVYLKYAAVIWDGLKNKRKDVEIPEKFMEQIEQVKAELFDSFKELTSAEAKLMLIEETTSSELVREYGEKLAYFRKTVILKNISVSDDEIEGLKADILNIRKKIFKALSASYKNI